MTGGRQVISKKRPKRAGDSIKVSYVGLGYDYGAFLSDLIWFSTPPGLPIQLSPTLTGILNLPPKPR